MTAHRSARTSRSRTAPASIPSTLWACGPAPIEVADSWPPRILTRALLEYSAPGDRVVLMPYTPDTEQLVGDLGRVLAPTPAQTRFADTDLILATTLPGTHEPGARTVADVASTRLRAGGLLVVLSRGHRDEDGVFHDPSGDLVTEAQNTDLLYLQHLVAAPIRGGEVVPAPVPLDATGVPQGSGEHSAPAGPDHVDVLVFLQPHDLTTAAA